MSFTRIPKLDLQVTHDLGAGEVTWRSVILPGSYYGSLFQSGAVSTLDWDNGAQDLNALIAGSPRWLLDGTDWVSTGDELTVHPNFFDGYGVVSWEIDAGPGQVPGTLHVACYLPGDDPDTPDSLTSYTLGPGSWATGALPISAGEFAADQYFDVRIRFVPEHLQTLL